MNDSNTLVHMNLHTEMHENTNHPNASAQTKPKLSTGLVVHPIEATAKLLGFSPVFSSGALLTRPGY